MSDGAVAGPLSERFGEDLQVLPESCGICAVRVRPGALLDVARWLKDHGFAMLLDIGGVDYLGRRSRSERFEVVYHFLDLEGRRRVRVHVRVDEATPEVDSLTPLWPAADWAEREVFDLFGIVFRGHPRLERILLPKEWQGHPLRKDYPLRGPERSREAQALRSRFAPPRLRAAEGRRAEDGGAGAGNGRSRVRGAGDGQA